MQAQQRIRIKPDSLPKDKFSSFRRIAALQALHAEKRYRYANQSYTACERQCLAWFLRLAPRYGENRSGHK